MTGAGKQAPRRLRADAARNRQALIDAAQRLYVSRGLSVTLDDIAAEAGVNVATAYRHFANKQELAQAYLQQQIDAAVEVAEDAAAAADAWEGLTGFLRRTTALIAANRALHDAFLSGPDTAWLDRLGERLDALLQGLIDRAQAAGSLRGDVQLGDLGVALQMLTTVTDIPAADQGALLDRYVALLLTGLRGSDPPLPGSAPTPANVRTATKVPSRRRGRLSGGNDGGGPPE